jgi:trehalose 6-phosphate synthase
VSSLQDGLNMVCKEFVSSQELSDPGVLILSEFAGAAEALGDDALLINPYDTDNFADTIKTALEMPLEERRRRMENLQKEVKENDIFKWTYGIFKNFKDVIPIANAMREGKLYRMGGDGTG